MQHVIVPDDMGPLRLDQTFVHVGPFISLYWFAVGRFESGKLERRALPNRGQGLVAKAGLRSFGFTFLRLASALEGAVVNVQRCSKFMCAHGPLVMHITPQAFFGAFGPGSACFSHLLAFSHACTDTRTF